MSNLLNKKFYFYLVKNLSGKKSLPSNIFSIISSKPKLAIENFSNMSCLSCNNFCNCENCSLKVINQKRSQHTNGKSHATDKAQRYIFNGTNQTPIFEMETNMKMPTLQDGEVLVKVRAATICISDIHTVCGARVEPTPSVLGHEACVEIVDHKRANFNMKIGDRATFCIADSCGECEFCKNNLSQKCVKLFKYGHASINNGTGFNGCYASHIVLRKGTHIIKLPDSISDCLGASINCALATMVNCVSHIPANVKRIANKALIQGDGMLGLYGCALLKELGFKEVYCSGHQTTRSELIKKFGAIPIKNEIEEMKNQANQIDCVIEVCGNPDALMNGIKLLKPGGAYILAGMVHPQSKLNVTGEQIIRKCLTIKGIHNYEGIHLEKSVEFLEKTVKKYPYDELVASKFFKLNQLTEAIDLATKKVYPRICVKP